jgi:hypothetical protein
LQVKPNFTIHPSHDFLQIGIHVSSSFQIQFELCWCLKCRGMTHLQTSYLWILKFEFKFLNQTQSNRGRFELNTGTDALDRTHAPGVSRRGVTRHLGVRVLPIPPDRRILRPPSSFGARGPSKLGDAFLHAPAPASAVARPPPCRPPATPCAGLPRLLSLFTLPPFLRGELTRPPRPRPRL